MSLALERALLPRSHALTKYVVENRRHAGHIDSINLGDTSGEVHTTVIQSEREKNGAGRGGRESEGGGGGKGGERESIGSLHRDHHLVRMRGNSFRRGIHNGVHIESAWLKVSQGVRCGTEILVRLQFAGKVGVSLGQITTQVIVC